MGFDFNGDLIGGSSGTHDGAVTINAADGGVFGNETMMIFNTNESTPALIKKGADGVSDRLEFYASKNTSLGSFVFFTENGSSILNLRGLGSIVYTNWNPQSSSNYDLGATGTRWRDTWS